MIPCYNETKRLATMLSECVSVLNSHFGPNNWEILLVDDGSKDGTFEYAIQWALDNISSSNLSQFRLTKLKYNRGKGGAVVHGMCHARGELVMFADADGASKFSDVTKLVEAVNAGPSKAVAAIGSRAHLVNTDAVVRRSFIRNLLMYGLHTLLYVFGIRTIRDTQCGFKLFTRRAAAEIFPYMHTEGWIFDVEVLILAEKKGIPVHEIAISWHEVPGSKIELAKDSIKMAIDLIVMRAAYILGIYKAHRVTVDRSVERDN